MRAFLGVIAFVAASLASSGGALALGCVSQDPLSVCVSTDAATSGDGFAAAGTGAVCIRDVDCVALAAAASCAVSTGDNAGAACKGAVAPGCPAFGVCLPPPPPPLSCPEGSFVVAYYMQNGVIIHVICSVS